MSDELIAPADVATGIRWRRFLPSRRTGLDFVVVVVALAAAGAFCGLVWESLWHAPQGLAFEKVWYLEPEGMPLDFSATGLYVLVAAIAGLLVSVVVALVMERDELVTLVGVLVGSAMAAWLMYAVGHRLGPPDPRVLAMSAADYDPLPSDLRIEAHGPTMSIGALHLTLPTAPFLAFPLGAVLGLALVYFVFGRRGSNAPASP
jgi:hypothetical protein